MQRIGRFEFWTWFGLELFIDIVVIAFANMAPLKLDWPITVAALLVVTALFNGFILFFVVPARFRDLGYTGWATILLWVPLLGLCLWVWLLLGAGNAGANKYGPAPERRSAFRVLRADLLHRER